MELFQKRANIFLAKIGSTFFLCCCKVGLNLSQHIVVHCICSFASRLYCKLQMESLFSGPTIRCRDQKWNQSLFEVDSIDGVYQTLLLILWCSRPKASDEDGVCHKVIRETSFFLEKCKASIPSNGIAEKSGADEKWGQFPKRFPFALFEGS